MYEIFISDFYATGRFLDKHNGAIAALSGVLVAYFTFTLWRVTKKLWLASEQQLDAFQLSLKDTRVASAEQTRLMSEQASASSRLAISAEATAILSLRAYVSAYPSQIMFLNKPVTEIKDPVPYTIVISISNMGRTPAYDLIVRKSWYCAPRGAGFPDDFAFDWVPRIPASHAVVVDSKSTLGPLAAAAETMTLNDTEVAQLLQGKAGLLDCAIYGEADYVDVFGKKQTSPFCYFIDTQFREGMSPFTAHSKHNTPLPPVDPI